MFSVQNAQQPRLRSQICMPISYGVCTRVRAALCTCTVRSVFSECEREGEWARFE